MFLPLKTALAAGLILLALGGTASATRVGIAGEPVYMPAPKALPEVRSGQFEEAYVAATLAPLRAADPDNNGLDRGDVLRERRKAEVRLRASATSRVLTFDLNGDGKVTRDEVVQAGKVESLIRRPPPDLWKYDGNVDGTITLKEIAAFVSAEAEASDQLAALLALDPNGDGVLSAAELERLAREAFAAADTDHNGKISPQEQQAQRKTAQMVVKAERCRMPPPAPGEQVVAVGVYEGGGMADVTVAGQDEATTAATILVEPGKTPIYLVLASYDVTLWRIEGDTRRVSRVVLSATKASPAGRSSAGVTGVDARNGTILPADCLRYFYPDQEQYPKPGIETSVQLARRQIAAYAGRSPDVVTGAYSPVQVSVPSGDVQRRSASPKAPPPPGFDPVVWREATRHYPEGLVRFDPRQVVAAVPAERYEVLPRAFGLAQLVSSGALQHTTGRTYRIVRRIPRFPSGLYGGHRVEFTVALGVPTPDGVPGHSCVKFEDERRALGVC